VTRSLESAAKDPASLVDFADAAMTRLASHRSA
jgi:hypothetical protein